MKQDVTETERNWSFRRNAKTCPQNKKMYLLLPLRHGHFNLILILNAKIVKLLQQYANTTVICL